jgi:hypothetical protein
LIIVLLALIEEEKVQRYGDDQSKCQYTDNDDNNPISFHLHHWKLWFEISSG